MRLDQAALASLPPEIGRPGYDRSAVTTGMLHFGAGAFHRAHQADYVDRLLGDDPRWGIAAFSMRSAGTVEALRRQDGLYTLAILDTEPSYRVIGAHTDFFDPDDGAAVRAMCGDPRVRIVTSTVTEKGYCLAADGTLDFGHPDIVHDLASPGAPRSLVGWLALGLRERRAGGLAPFTPVCCDNMPANGRKLGAAVVEFARRLDPSLAEWIAGEVRFPNTMVDSITPATDAAVIERVRAATGFDDAVPVSREAYAAWVIEDVLPANSPDFASAGAVLTSDVAAHELAKLRILNGAHSTLAYLGLLLGHETVAEGMADARLATFAERMVREDVIPTLRADFDLQAYAGDIFARFHNPAIQHKLTQIAWDGSQKLPYRLLETIRERLAVDAPIDRLVLPIAAWMLFLEQRAQTGIPIVDPLAERLVEIGRGTEAARELLALREIFPPDLAADERFRAPLLRGVTSLRGNVTATIEAHCA